MYPRKLKTEIDKYLDSRDIVVIHGARQVGKTTLLQMIGQGLPPEDQHYMDLEDGRLLELCQDGPQSVIDYLRQRGSYGGQKRFYLLLDEVQHLANPSSFLKLFHDHHPGVKLIVTGSSSFEIKRKFKDSLAGRTVEFTLYPLDFEEFLNFKGRQYDLRAAAHTSVIQQELEGFYREYALYGGFPKIVLTDQLEIKEKYLQQIIDTYIKKDIRDLGSIRDVGKFNSLLRVLASQSGSLLNVAELANTARLARQTVEQYLFILENTYIIKLVRPYTNNLRSELFKTPKIYFLDSGLMQLLTDRRLPLTLGGPAFETSVFSDLIKSSHAELFFWRTQDKKEIDFIATAGKQVIPLEAKMNSAGFKATALEYFMSHYGIRAGYCLSLSGERALGGEDIGLVRPWELYRILAGPRT